MTTLTTPERIAQIKSMHKAYIAITGRDVIMDFNGAMEHQWFDWMKMGFTESDLKLVVDYIRKGISKNSRLPGALKFQNLIGDPIRFGDDLAEARAMSRAPKPHPAHRELCATGRPAVKESAPARSLEQIIEGEKAFAAFRAMKEGL